MMKKLFVAALGALLFAAVPAIRVKALAAYPCAPDLDPPTPPRDARPSAPTGLRILRGPAASTEPAFSAAPEALSAAAATSGTHAYFEALALRPDCFAAYRLRSQEELDSIETGSVSEKKLPVKYDAAMDAARFSIFAPVTTDSQQKLFAVKIDTGSLLLTWDFQFDQYFAWQEGYISRHKTWRFDVPGPWISLKTDYVSAAHDGRFAELFMSINSSSWLAPGTTRGEREILFPRLAQFYIEPDTWTRAWLLLQDLDQAVSSVSVWVADERRDPVQLYDRLALNSPPYGLLKFRMEYDNSGDTALNPTEAHSWNRNLVMLRNVPPSAIPALLQRPVR